MKCCSLALALGLCLEPWAPSLAQTREIAHHFESFQMTEDEQRADQLFDQGKFIESRELAQRILEQGPSIVATVVLARVHYEIEGNFARALFLVRQARRDFRARYGEPPEEPTARFWCRTILRLESLICASMDRRAEQLAVDHELVRYFHMEEDEVIQIWPLLKERRFDEARELGRRLIHSEDPDVRLTAYNSLIAVEDEVRNRKAGYEIGTVAHRMTGGNSCVISMNYALCALQMYKIEDAAPLNLEAVHAINYDCSSHPHLQGAAIYLLQGDYQRALSSLLELRKIPTRASRRVQNEMTIRGRVVELLYAMGQVEEALVRVMPIADRTDRTGSTSASTENYILRDLLLYWLMGDVNLRWREELRSARGAWESAKMRLEDASLVAKQLELVHRALPYTLSDALLTDLARAYYTDIRPWYFGSLAGLFGHALFERIVNEAWARETDELEVGRAYYDGYLAELRLRQGRLAEARELCEKALDKLPKLERLFRLRVQAIYADLLVQEGREAEAAPLYNEVIELFPAVLRMLDLRLPVVFYDDGSPIAKAVVQLLRNSPRLKPGQGSLELHVERLEDTARCCLVGAHGRRLFCTVLDWTSDEAQSIGDDLEKQAIAAVDAFHKQAFAPMIEMTAQDLNSLDGRAGKVSADAALKDLLNDGSSKTRSREDAQ